VKRRRRAPAPLISLCHWHPLLRRHIAGGFWTARGPHTNRGFWQACEYGAVMGVAALERQLSVGFDARRLILATVRDFLGLPSENWPALKVVA